jgi:hypothetical protein
LPTIIQLGSGAVGATTINHGAEVWPVRHKIGTALRHALMMFAPAASFGVAALVANTTFVLTFSPAEAAETQERDTPFSFIPQTEEFWRRFGTDGWGAGTGTAPS